MRRLTIWLVHRQTLWQGASAHVAGDAYTSASGHDARLMRHLLLPALHAIRDATGYISPGGLNYVCQRLNVPPADAYGVASFYALFSLEPTPPVVAHVCDDIACRINGALGLCDALAERLGPEGHPHDGSGATWHRSPCLGMCERAPAVLIQRAGEGMDDESIGPATFDQVVDAIERGPTTPEPDVLQGSPWAPQTQVPSARRELRLLRRIRAGRSGEH